MRYLRLKLKLRVKTIKEMNLKEKQQLIKDIEKSIELEQKAINYIKEMI